MQPFEKHAADPAELEASRHELLARAEEASELSDRTTHAYQPAIEHWEGVGEAELESAPDPLLRDSQAGAYALAWAAVVVSYWAREVRTFNATVDRIIGDDPYFGAAPVDGALASMEALEAARHQAERRLWEAYNTHILDGESRGDVAGWSDQ